MSVAGQNHAAVPFYSGGRQASMSLLNPTASVLAGVGAALGESQVTSNN